MAVRIRLLRKGKIRNPQYRIVVADSRKKRDGRTIESLGIYHPKEEPSRIEVDSERVQYWLSVGAQPSDPVRAILRRTGDWQRFRGLPPPAHPLKAAPPRVDQHAVYQAEAKAAAGLADQPGKGEAAKPAGKKAAKKATKAQKADRSDKADKSEKPDAADKTEKAEQSEQSDKADEPDKPAKAVKAPRTAKTAKKAAPKAEADQAGSPEQAAEAAGTPAEGGAPAPDPDSAGQA